MPEEFSVEDFAPPREEEFQVEDFLAPVTIEQVKPTPYEKAKLAGVGPMGPFGPETPDLTTAVAADIQRGTRAAGRAFDVARQAIIAAPADVGEATLKYPTLDLGTAMTLTALTREPEEPPSNIEALRRGEPLPAITQRRVLPPVLRGIETGAQELLGSAPKLAAVAGAQMVGVPAPVAAGAVFGLTPEGFDPKQAAIAVALPIIGKWTGELSEVLAKSLGVASPEARAIINRLGGVGGASAVLTADQWNEIRKLPEDQQKAAWADAVGNVAGMAVLGAVGQGPMLLRPERTVDVETMRRAEPARRPAVEPPEGAAAPEPPAAPAPRPPEPTLPPVLPEVPPPAPPVPPPAPIAPVPPVAPAPPAPAAPVPPPAAPPPPAPPGTVTLYTGKGGVGGAGEGGSWFTANIEKAKTYGPDVRSVQVPADVAEEAKRRAREQGQGGDTYFLTRDYADKAEPVEGLAPKAPIEITEKPTSPVDTLKATIEAGKGNTPEAYKAGMASSSISHLDELKAALTDAANKLKSLNEQTAAAKTPAERLALLKQKPKLVYAQQYYREAIEAATNIMSAEESKTPLGARPLDWQKDPKVAQWLKENAPQIYPDADTYALLPDALKAAAPAPPAGGVVKRPGPAAPPPAVELAEVRDVDVADDPRLEMPGITKQSQPNSLIVQLRDLDSNPVREIVLPTSGDPITDAKTVEATIKANLHGNLSLRESLGVTTGPNGRAILKFGMSPNGMTWASAAKWLKLVESRRAGDDAKEADLKRAREGLQSRLPGALDYGYSSGLADELMRGEWKPGTGYFDYWIKHTDELKRAAWAIERYFDTKWERDGDRARVKALNDFIDQNIEAEAVPTGPAQLPAPVTPPAATPPSVTAPPQNVTAVTEEEPDTRSIMQAVQVFADAISKGELTKQGAIEFLDAWYGGTMAEGKYSAKDLTDAIEMGINQWILSHNINPANASAGEAIQAITMLKDMLARTPTQTTRTAEMDRLQQFSTPPPHAYVVNWVANLNRSDVVLEPSAGVGGIAVFAKLTGAKVIGNELSKRRAALLQQSGIADQVTTHNAELIHAFLAPAIQSGATPQPTAVVMNPPFSNAATTEQKNTLVGAKHVESALETLPPGGRLVAIVGEGMAMNKPTFVPWWRKIAAKFNIRANIGISGKEYAKYGTHFGNQIIVIDKTGPTPDLGAVVTGNVDKVEDLIPLLEGIKNDRPAIKPAPAQPSRPQPPPAGGGAPVPAAPPHAPVGPRLPGPPRPAGGAARPPVPAIQGPGGLVSVPQPPAVSPVGAGRPPVPPTGPTPAAPAPVAGGARQPPASGVGEAGLTLEQKVEGEHELIEHGVYSEYKPRKVAIAGALPHATPLVETTAMASVEPVDPHYRPNIPQDLITSGALSDAQLEQIVYAGQAHEVILPNGERMGYFVGDGTGVGKGRIISGIGLDNWNRGRKKMVWVSVKKELIKDTTRDLTALGFPADRIINANKKKGENLINAGDGIAFVTYSGLSRGNPGLTPIDPAAPHAVRTLLPGEAGAPKSRLQLLYEWLGKDFDGVIAFDEAHKAGNAIDIRGARGIEEASLTGTTVLDVQALFPKARIVYSSATGASSVTNLSYADRLGIWGEGTPWPNKAAFFNDIQAGGLSAMEIVARDLKSMGRYLARTLSFEGVTKRQLVHDLTPEQIGIYNQLSDAWQIVLAARNETMAHTGAAKNGHARGKANSALYNAQQRFYNQLLTAIQMPSVLVDMRANLEAGNTLILSLVSTNEATLTREIAAKGGEEEADENWVDDIDLSPKQILLAYIEKSYPTQLYQPVTDDNGNVRWRPVTQQLPDGTRVPVMDPAALAKKQELLDRMALLQAPENPLEMILNEFGHENVAEITGRKKRLINKKQPDGTFKQVIENRNDAKRAQEQKDVEDGKRRILVHSGKGGTGFTFSSSRAFKNQQRRIDYIIQAGWRSDEALQAMGRTHRNDQAVAPDYALVSTNLRGHQRFMSTIARRLAEMGALTGGERKGAGGDLFTETNNLENQYAEDAVEMLFRDLHHGTIPGMDFNEVARQLGYTRVEVNEHSGEVEHINTLVDRDGGLNSNKVPTIQQFLNRILAMRFHDQNNLFDEFMDRMQTRIERAKEDGSYDPGTQTLKASNVKKLEDKVVYQHPSSTAKTRLVEIQYDLPVKTTSYAEVSSGKPIVKFVRNRRSTKLYALKEGPNRTLESGTIVQTYRRIGPGTSDLIARDAIDDFLQGDEAKWDKMNFVSNEDAQRAWDEELALTPQIRTMRDTYVVGAFLPIWDRLEIPDPKIWRITAGKETFLGAHVPPGMVRDVRTRLGAGSGEAASPEATFNDILVRNTKIELANGWELKRSRVQGEARIEVVGMSYDEGKQFVDKMGGFMERIQYQPRYFIPTDQDTGVRVLTRILQQSPPIPPQAPPPPGMSVGPGGASPGDVPPPPPPAAGVASQPSWDRPNGAMTPSTPGLTAMVKNLGRFILSTMRGLGGQTFPRTTLADREAGEALARYAAARGAALRLAKVFSTQTLAGTGVDPAMLGEALAEDNLRSVREGFRAMVTQLTAERKPQEAAVMQQRADAVVSLIGNLGSHFADEDAYQDFLAQGPVKQAIRQHIQQWEEVIDPQFKLAMRLDPDTELPSRGLQTGARVNLKAVFPDEQGVNVVGRGGPSLTATFRRKTPFARQAKGTGLAYEVNYHELIANSFQRQLEIAAKNEADRALTDSGNAKIAPPGQAIEVAGERGIPFPLSRQMVILPGRGAFSQSRTLYVRQSLAREYRTAANVDASFSIPVITPIMNLLNRAALAGLTDFTVHMSNQFTSLFVRPVSGGLLSDTLLSLTGRADVPVTLFKAFLKMFGDHEKQLSELAEIGALREPHRGRNPLGKILAKTDQTTRLLLDDAFQRLVEAGLVPNTETDRREYANAIGQYNKRMISGPITRFLRETGFGPFVIAGKTFNVLGVKVVTMSPGSKATNAFAAAALRANLLAKWVGFVLLLGVLNYLLTKDKKGGPLGRKGVPLGNLDTGKTNAAGRPLSIPLMDILGLGRGARVTGLKGYVQAKYLGLTDGNALDAASRDIINSAIGPAMGPGPRAAAITATGSAPAVNVPRTAPVAPPGQNQTAVNLMAALKEANPLVRTALDLQEGKTTAEAIGRQFPRFAMRPGMEATKAENMPKVVNAAQLNAYAEALAKQARALPLAQRYQFVQARLRADNLNVENKSRALIILERQGVFKYR